MKPIKFSWLAFALLLAAIIVSGLLSDVNNDGLDGFFQSLASGNGWLLLCAVLTVLLIIWVVLAVTTGGLSDGSNKRRGA
ncbi:hypothetical protein [Hymenobacter sp. B81]|uniref:hypothetical protein n=1 Tax=Hymenobacter sp. B81 TaxID=3344878 RepID=UPI0037DC097E